MTRRPLNPLTLCLCFLLSSLAARGADRPKSPGGEAATQVGGKWIVVTYSRPILRGRTNIFGAGADYGKTVNARAPVWRVGANKTTTLTTEAPLMLGGQRLATGSYDLFVELKEGAWTLIVSTQPASDKYPPPAKSLWGSYGYDPKFDVVRLPMTLSASPTSVDELTIGFVDVTGDGGKLQIAWDHTVATAPFTVVR